tara:strand:+ start:903 stop:1844 length:942 start_codon:yes stop_codon:yes gene_type:complete
MKILGAGMSGLLAGQHFRTHNPKIIERQDCIPNNHAALLRFRTKIIQSETKIRLKEVKVQKMINYKENHFTESNLFFNNLYSQKVILGRTESRSIGDLKDCTRYIAPDDFIDRLSHGLNIIFGEEANRHVEDQISNPENPMISTIPMKILAEMLDYDLNEDLKTIPIKVVNFELSGASFDIYQTVYYPNPTLPFYRISITGSRVIAEFHKSVPYSKSEWDTEEKIFQNLYHFLEIDFGIVDFSAKDLVIKTQHHGKLINCDPNVRKKFLRFITHKYNIYCLGRWGTHRQILMDDVVNDLNVIDNMISSDRYER